MQNVPNKLLLLLLRYGGGAIPGGDAELGIRSCPAYSMFAQLLKLALYDTYLFFIVTFKSLAWYDGTAYSLYCH